MRLTYRGVDYDYNPPSLEMSESEITGRYRGRSYQFSYVRHVPFPQPVAELTYRGVAYKTNAQGQVEAAPSPTAVNRQDAAVGLHPVRTMAEARRQLLKEAALAHRTNIQRSLEHRIAVARNQGNEPLVRQLEEEMHHLA
jgi:Domain of unknown function (DUF4278)